MARQTLSLASDVTISVPLETSYLMTDIIQAASALLRKIDNLTTDDFSKGGEHDEREALRALLVRFGVDGVE